MNKEDYLVHSHEHIDTLRRENDAETSLLPGTFPIITRCYVDPMHLGQSPGSFARLLCPFLLAALVMPSDALYLHLSIALRLGEKFLTVLAAQIGVSNSKKQVDLWNSLMLKTTVVCEPYQNRSSSAMTSDGNATLVLPSLKLEQLFKVIRNFPYAELKGVKKYKTKSKSTKKSAKRAAAAAASANVDDTDDYIDWEDFYSLALLFCESMEAIIRRDDSLNARNVCSVAGFPVAQAVLSASRSDSSLFLQLFEITAHMFSAVLGNITQWYVHALAYHVWPTLHAGVDLWSISTSTGEARQRVQVSLTIDPASVAPDNVEPCVSH